jgi:hypothetical protein
MYYVRRPTEVRRILPRFAEHQQESHVQAHTRSQQATRSKPSEGCTIRRMQTRPARRRAAGSAEGWSVWVVVESDSPSVLNQQLL